MISRVDGHLLYIPSIYFVLRSQSGAIARRHTGRSKFISHLSLAGKPTLSNGAALSDEATVSLGLPASYDSVFQYLGIRRAGPVRAVARNKTIR